MLLLLDSVKTALSTASPSATAVPTALYVKSTTAGRCVIIAVRTTFFCVLKRKLCANLSYDAAIMPDPVAEGLFLTGQEAPAILITPLARIRIAA